MERINGGERERQARSLETKKKEEEAWKPSVLWGQLFNYEVKLGANGPILILCIWLLFFLSKIFPFLFHYYS